MPPRTPKLPDHLAGHHPEHPSARPLLELLIDGKRVHVRSWTLRLESDDVNECGVLFSWDPPLPEEEAAAREE